METLRRDLEREVGGRKVKAVVVEDALLVDGVDAASVRKAEGAKLTSVRRRPGALVFVLDTGDRLVLEIRDGVALRKAKGDEPFLLELSFTQGGPLRVLAGVGDPKLWFGPDTALDEHYPQGTGLDVATQATSWVTFARSLVASGGAVRHLLTDPDLLVGIGPMYADEILWQAGLRPDRRAEKLGTQELRRLYRSTAEVMHEALKAGGTTTAANHFTDLAGKPGAYQDQLEAWGRNGKPCRRCRSTIVLEKFEGKPSYRCAQCQV
jgi:formamidopyrimidine-DNA glycosylase